MKKTMLMISVLLSALSASAAAPVRLATCELDQSKKLVIEAPAGVETAVPAILTDARGRQTNLRVESSWFMAIGWETLKARDSVFTVKNPRTNARLHLSFTREALSYGAMDLFCTGHISFVEDLIAKGEANFIRTLSIYKENMRLYGASGVTSASCQIHEMDGDEAYRVNLERLVRKDKHCEPEFALKAYLKFAGTFRDKQKAEILKSIATEILAKPSVCESR